MEAPRPEEYGLTEARLDEVDKRLWRTRVAASAPAGLIAFLLGLNAFYGFFVGRNSRDLTYDMLMFGLPISIFLAVACGMAFFLLLLSLPVSLWDEHGKVRRYQAALAEFRKRRQQSQTKFWSNLSGKRLQAQVGELYRKMGYEVLSPPPGEGEWTDFVLKNEEVTVFVYCRAQQGPVDWQPVHALVEAQKRHKAERAVCISILGYTAKAKRYAVNKPLGLLSVRELSNIQSRLEAFEKSEAQAPAPS
jgi:hypothetical protein